MSRILTEIRKSKSYISDYRIFFFLLLILPVWAGISDEWYDYFNSQANCGLIKSAYFFLNGRWLVNIPICIVVTTIFVGGWRRILKERVVRLYRWALVIVTFFILYWNCKVSYADIAGSFSYQTFIAVLAGTTALFLVINAFDVFNASRLNSKERGLGFSKALSEESAPDYLREYASSIIKRIENTSVADESYAIGIVGEWGVGKTTFLNLLRKELKNEFEVVDFNPWMCNSPEQVTHDFFVSLRRQLSKRYSTLSKSIKEYSKNINGLTFAPYHFLNLEMIFNQKKESLYERKMKLSEKFSSLAAPVVVLIDDIDRLERDEVFEVLRLIRNTGDLKNTVYIAAYDKNYVLGVLEEKNIKNGDAFMEKIFPVEIPLPKIEDHFIWDALKDEIYRQTVEPAKTQSLFNSFNSNDKFIILQILNTFRRVKRFARIYSFTVSHIHKANRRELNAEDVFWLVLLQVYDQKIYYHLSSAPHTLLIDKDGKYELLPGIISQATEKDRVKYKGDKDWKNHTCAILNKLFGTYRKSPSIGICYVENYDKYFTLGNSKFKVSVKEFLDFIISKEDAETIVKRWIDEGKFFSSIAFRMKSVRTDKLKDYQLRHYIFGAMSFGLETMKYSMTPMNEVKKILKKNNFDTATSQKVRGYVLEWFENKITSADRLPDISRFLKALFVSIYSNEHHEEECPVYLVVENEKIKDLLKHSMERFLNKEHPKSVMDLTDEESLLGMMFRNCCVLLRDSADDEIVYEQVSYDVLIPYLEKIEDKPWFKDFENAISRPFYDESLVFHNQEDQYEYWDYMQEKFERKMIEVFGNTYFIPVYKPGTFSEFRSRCFAPCRLMKTRP